MESGNQTSSSKTLDQHDKDIEMSDSFPSITEYETHPPLEKKPRLFGQYSKGELPDDEEEGLDGELLMNYDYVYFNDDVTEEDEDLGVSCIEPPSSFHIYKDFLEFVIKKKGEYKNAKLLKVIYCGAFWHVTITFEADLDGVKMTCRASGTVAYENRDHSLSSFSSVCTPIYAPEDLLYAEEALLINWKAFHEFDIKDSRRISRKTMCKILRDPKLYKRIEC